MWKILSDIYKKKTLKSPVKYFVKNKIHGKNPFEKSILSHNSIKIYIYCTGTKCWNV